MGKMNLGKGLVKGLKEAVAYERGELNLRVTTSVSKNDLLSLEDRLNEIEARPIPEKVLEVIKEHHHHNTVEKVVEKTETVVKEVSVRTHDRRARQHSKALRGYLTYHQLQLNSLKELISLQNDEIELLKKQLNDSHLKLEDSIKSVESKIPQENQELEKTKRIVTFLIIGMSLTLSLIAILK